MSIESRIEAAITAITGLPAESINGDDCFEIGLGMDDVEKVHLMLAIESDFGIAISDAEIEQTDTVEELQALVRSKLPADAWEAAQA